MAAERLRVEPGPGGVRRVDASWAAPFLRSGTVRLRVLPDAGCDGGSVFAEPIRFHCADGLTELTDWADLGLAEFSGIARYTTTVSLPDAAGDRVTLRLGEVAATASVRVNGRDAGTVIAPPYEIDVTGLVRAGENIVDIEVANTLGNFYSTLPTPYAAPGRSRSGLLGPVSVTVDSR